MAKLSTIQSAFSRPHILRQRSKSVNSQSQQEAAALSLLSFRNASLLPLLAQTSPSLPKPASSDPVLIVEEDENRPRSPPKSTLSSPFNKKCKIPTMPRLCTKGLVHKKVVKVKALKPSLPPGKPLHSAPLLAGHLAKMTQPIKLILS